MKDSEVLSIIKKIVLVFLGVVLWLFGIIASLITIAGSDYRFVIGVAFCCFTAGTLMIYLSRCVPTILMIGVLGFYVLVVADLAYRFLYRLCTDVGNSRADCDFRSLRDFGNPAITWGHPRGDRRVGHEGNDLFSILTNEAELVCDERVVTNSFQNPGSSS